VCAITLRAYETPLQANILRPGSCYRFSFAPGCAFLNELGIPLLRNPGECLEQNLRVRWFRTHILAPKVHENSMTQNTDGRI